MWEWTALPNGSRRGREKECYDNARRLSEKLNLFFVEGFGWLTAQDALIPHAWCGDGNQRAFDPTWRFASQSIRYIGIPLEDWLVQENLEDSIDDRLGSVLDMVVDDPPDDLSEIVHESFRLRA